MRWLDLSVPLHTGMPVYPGDPEVLISRALTVESDGVNVLALALGSHSGTHLDAPLHSDEDWAALERLPMGQFSGTVELVDVRPAGGGTITAAMLAGMRSALDPEVDPGAPRRILLLRTGFSDRWGQDAYLSHPALDSAAAQLIFDRGYRTVGVDALSIDHSDGADSALPAHRILAGNGCVIVENLTGLDQVAAALEAGSEVEIFLYPLNIPGADGSPIRAVARVTPAVPAPVSRADVEAAAGKLMEAFGATDTDAYFAAFSPEATFIFHPERESLDSRAAYRNLWESWVSSGWKVLACTSTERNIALAGDTAIFTHRVATVVQDGATGERIPSDERETIVFTRMADGNLLAVHEHLSPVPAPGGTS